ncbi:MAG: GNAT family N-acetyltransferase [Alphaproteobacteria bacterium]|nr:GNAT family N-acetyltransferase [Alphaproteobacteria bacterium]
MIQIRILSPADLPLIEAHLLRLAPEDRRLRFGFPLKDDAVRAHCRALPWPHALLFGHVQAGVLLGLGMLAWDAGVARADWRRDGELAVTVDRAARRQGIGAALTKVVVLAARNRWLRRLHIHYLTENLPMQALARTLHPVVTVEAGESEASLELAPPTQMSMAQEWLTEIGGWSDAMLDLFRLKPRPAPAEGAPAPAAARARA